MSIHLLIHKTNPESCEQISKYLFNRLDAIFPDMVQSYANGQLITVGRGAFIYIDFQCGTDYYRLAGVRPDFYYTDSDDPDILDMLEQGASKCSGKKLDSIDRVINIVGFYMEMLEQIDEYLKEGEV